MMKHLAGAALESVPVLIVMALGAFACRRAMNRIISRCNSALQRVECAGIGGTKV
jgi:hypothetical protein